MGTTTHRPPLDLASLHRVLVAPDESTGLPAEAYTSPEVFAWEREMAGRQGWTCIGRAADFSAKGHQQAVTVHGEGILVVHGKDGLSTFVNACRHRGHELVKPGCTVKRTNIWCSYHAWVYQQDGALRSAPRFENLPLERASELGLLPVRSTQWNGWLFVNLSGDAPRFADAVGNLDELLKAYGLADLQITARHEYDLAANWKLLVENYLECYHCPSTHPELSRVQRTGGGLNFPSTGLWLGGYLDLRNTAGTMSLNGTGPDWTFPGLDADRARQVCYYGLLPNLFVTAMHDYVVTHRLEPLAPDHTRVVCEVLFSPELLAQGFDPDYAADFWHTTNQQDWDACSSVQRGITRPGFVPGPLAPQEDALHTFLATMAACYRDNRPLRDTWAGA